MRKSYYFSKEESVRLIQDSNQMNRAFLYGDALFDTIVYKNSKLIFAEAHYFRLLAGMRQLRMEIPDFFTQDYWEDQLIGIIVANNLQEARVRTSVYRDTTGLYTPKHNNVAFIISVDTLNYSIKEEYRLGVYKDYLLSTNQIDTIKTTNRIHNVLASIYAKENNLDNCVLLNHKKQITETIHANIFLVSGHSVKTPSLDAGCINGIVRQKLINYLHKSEDFELIETSIEPYELLQADEIFITNSVIGIQHISSYKRKEFPHSISDFLRNKICK